MGEFGKTAGRRRSQRVFVVQRLMNAAIERCASMILAEASLGTLIVGCLSFVNFDP
jgi:hypothetical protein